MHVVPYQLIGRQGRVGEITMQEIGQAVDDGMLSVKSVLVTTVSN